MLLVNIRTLYNLNPVNLNLCGLGLLNIWPNFWNISRNISWNICQINKKGSKTKMPKKAKGQGGEKAEAKR
jgi:hypothetical protein